MVYYIKGKWNQKAQPKRQCEVTRTWLRTVPADKEKEQGPDWWVLRERTLGCQGRSWEEWRLLCALCSSFYKGREEPSGQCLYVMADLGSQFGEIKNELEDSPLGVSVMMFSVKILWNRNANWWWGQHPPTGWVPKLNKKCRKSGHILCVLHLWGYMTCCLMTPLLWLSISEDK